MVWLVQLKRDEALRQELSRKVEFKNERMAAIEEQRRSLMMELEDTRKEIAVHDNLLRVCATYRLSISRVTFASLVVPETAGFLTNCRLCNSQLLQVCTV